MRTQIFLITLLASLSFAASAENYIINQAYEVPVNDLRLPGHVVGTIAFKECSKCQLRTLPVTTETRYVLDDRDVSLAKFNEIVNAIRDKKNIATVIHHLKSDTVVAVLVVK